MPQHMKRNPIDSRFLQRAIGHWTGLATAALLHSALATANEQQPEWWFDVELIVFKRDVQGADLHESFPEAITAIPIEDSKDLLSDHLHPNIRTLQQSLPWCQHDSALTENLALADVAASAPNFPSVPSPAIALATTSPQASGNPKQLAATVVSDGVDAHQTNRRGDAQTNSNHDAVPHSNNMEQLRAAFAMPTTPSSQTTPTKAALPSSRASDLVRAATSGANSASTRLEPLATPVDIPAIHYRVPQHLGCRFSNEQFASSIMERLAPVHRTYGATTLGTTAPYLQLPSPLMEQVPKLLVGKAGEETESISKILAPTELMLSELARDIDQQTDLQLMSHLGWRQAVVFGRKQAPNYRLYAGKNFGLEYHHNGLAIASDGDQSSLPRSQLPIPPMAADNRATALATTTDALFKDIQRALLNWEQSDTKSATKVIAPTTSHSSTETIPQTRHIPAPTTSTDVWELDGVFKVYLQRIGSVNYLHIDSQLNFRQPLPIATEQLSARRSSLEIGSPQQASDAMLPLSALLPQPAPSVGQTPTQQWFLKAYPFKQLRRVISRQIHYFDHPMFGIVVQIRRHRIPDFMQ